MDQRHRQQRQVQKTLRTLAVQFMPAVIQAEYADNIARGYAAASYEALAASCADKAFTMAAAFLRREAMSTPNAAKVVEEALARLEPRKAEFDMTAAWARYGVGPR